MRLPAINMRSVRFRTTAGAALALVALLVVAGLAINWFVGRAVQRSSDSILLEQASDRAALISQGAPVESLIKPVGDEEIVAVVSADGTVLASAGLLDESQVRDLPLGLSDIAVLMDEEGEEPHDEELRAAAVQTADGRQVIVANESELAESTLGSVRAVLLLVIPLTAIAAAALAWLGTGRALEPVRNMRAELDDVVRAGDGRRVTKPATGDEIDELGSTINAVLDRIDAGSLAQRQFVADASHELKSPLANARATLDTAPQQIDQDAYDRVAGVVSGELNRLHSLVDDLLYLARGDEGPPRASRPTDLADLVFDECERVAAMSAKRIDASHVAPVQVMIDSAEVTRAIRNLVENAERFATEQVTVSIDTRDDFAVLVVADDGPGIAEQDRDSVFERFSRLDSDRARDAGGTGLGLSIVASIAQHNAGWVAVDESPAGGAQFELALPLTP